MGILGYESRYSLQIYLVPTLDNLVPRKDQQVSETSESLWEDMNMLCTYSNPTSSSILITNNH